MLRVVSYNVHGCVGLNNKLNTNAIVDTLLALDADIYCLQEVHCHMPNTKFSNQIAMLKKRLNMDTYFLRCLNIGVGGEGLLIATRLQITSVHKSYLPSIRERRGLLGVDVNTPMGELCIYCTHWGLNRDERLRQASVVSSKLLSVQKPTILCGDLNDLPGSLAIQTLLHSACLKDAGADSDLPTYPAAHPTHRIDYWLHTTDLTVQRFEVVMSTASDHRLITADLG